MMRPEGGKLWIIYHPRNLLGVAAVLVVLVAWWAHTPDPSGARPAQAATPTATAATTVAEAPPFTPEPTQAATTRTTNPYLSMTGVAEKFVTAWASPKLAQSEWLAGIGPWSTPKLAGQLAATDPAQITATALTGNAALIKYGPGWAWAWVQVPTDGGDLVVSMVSQPSDECEVCSTWLVSNVQPLDESTGKAVR